MSAPTGLKRPATFDHLKKKQPLERRVTIALDQETLEAFDAAGDALERAKLLNEPTEELETALEEARAKLEETSAVLVFRSIGRKAYDRLVDTYPPTPEQIKEFQEDNPDREGNPGKGKPPYDIDHFAPALVAASCVDPAMTIEEVTELFDEWNAVEVAELWVAALEVNTQRRVVSLGNG
jgi:hypothetical protein